MSNSNSEFTMIEVGKPFDLFTGRDMKGQTGCVTEFLDGLGFVSIIYMDNMTINEQITLGQAKIQVKVIKETDDFVLTLLKFGKTPLVFEMAFDPTLYQDERRELFNKTNMLAIIAVDSNTNIIKALRYCSMPLALHDLFKRAWNLALQRENFNEKYMNWVRDLDSRYSVIQLWDMGKNYGEMGQQEFIKP